MHALAEVFSDCFAIDFWLCMYVSFLLQSQHISTLSVCFVFLSYYISCSDFSVNWCCFGFNLISYRAVDVECSTVSGGGSDVASGYWYCSSLLVVDCWRVSAVVQLMPVHHRPSTLSLLTAMMVLLSTLSVLLTATMVLLSTLSVLLTAVMVTLLQLCLLIYRHVAAVTRRCTLSGLTAGMYVCLLFTLSVSV